MSEVCTHGGGNSHHNLQPLCAANVRTETRAGDQEEGQLHSTERYMVSADRPCATKMYECAYVHRSIKTCTALLAARRVPLPLPVMCLE